MTKGRVYNKTNADTYMRGKLVKEVGALLDQMLLEDVTTLKIIISDFGTTYDTIKDLRNKNSSISHDTIRKFCYVIGYYLSQEIQAVEDFKKNVRERESRLKMLYEMKETYKKIYGMQATIALNLIHKGTNLSAFVLQG